MEWNDGDWWREGVVYIVEGAGRGGQWRKEAASFLLALPSCPTQSSSRVRWSGDRQVLWTVVMALRVAHHGLIMVMAVSVFRASQLPQAHAADY